MRSAGLSTHTGRSSLFPSIATLHQQFLTREQTPEQLLERCLARIDSHESQVRAWVMLDRSGARQRAQEQTAWLRDNQPTTLPPLFGIPIGVKDVIDVATWPTLAGSRSRTGHVATGDATAVTRLRAAGGILLGKTVTTEFACFDPATTRNPWNLAHTPGGSSSGSAAAVAAGMCIAAVGTQTGGSILRPASFCGLVGYKPPFGSVPLDGVVPVATSLDHLGPLTRCVSDARRVAEVLTQQALPVSAEVSPLRFGTIVAFFRDKAIPEAAQCQAALLEKWSPLEVVEPPVPIAELHRVHRIIMAKECAEVHRTAILQQPELFSPGVTALVEEGVNVSLVTYASAQAAAREARAAWRELFTRLDLLLLPTTAGPAPATLQTTGDPRWQSPWSLLGFPALTLPYRLASNGLPLGFQLVARDESLLFTFAAQVEAELAFSLAPPLRNVATPDPFL
jgi:aspartyl-tRNA(Asn)/glutamyl-tRNA(Gln) amidotransferase subunit A